MQPNGKSLQINCAFLATSPTKCKDFNSPSFLYYSNQDWKQTELDTNCPLSCETCTPGFEGFAQENLLQDLGGESSIGGFGGVCKCQDGQSYEGERLPSFPINIHYSHFPSDTPLALSASAPAVSALSRQVSKCEREHYQMVEGRTLVR